MDEQEKLLQSIGNTFRNLMKDLLLWKIRWILYTIHSMGM